MTLATILAAALLPVIPQPTEWKPTTGECDLAAAKDGHYTKKEFRDFMLFCKSIGVTVVPEIDVPAHSLAFTRVRPDFASKKYGADHLDLDKSEEILAWLKPLFAEYMTGDAPTFIGPYMHVGTDEYNKAEAEKFRAFQDALFKMVMGFGYKPCAWGSLDNAKGQTPVIASRDIMIDVWNNRYYHPENALKAGYTIVSIPDKIVYLVPFGGYYNDYFDCKKMYEWWEPRINWRYTVPDKYMDQLAGGKFALWNDLCGKKKDGTPYTEADNWDRIHPALQTFAQKMWCGNRPDQPWKHFAATADALSEPAGVKSRHTVRLLHTFEVSKEKDAFLLDGKVLQIRCGEMHFAYVTQLDGKGGLLRASTRSFTAATSPTAAWCARWSSTRRRGTRCMVACRAPRT